MMTPIITTKDISFLSCVIIMRLNIILLLRQCNIILLWNRLWLFHKFFHSKHFMVSANILVATFPEWLPWWGIAKIISSLNDCAIVFQMIVTIINHLKNKTINNLREMTFWNSFCGKTVVILECADFVTIIT